MISGGLEVGLVSSQYVFIITIILHIMRKVMKWLPVWKRKCCLCNCCLCKVDVVMEI